MLSSLRQGIDMNKLLSVVLKAISHETRFILCMFYEREDKRYQQMGALPVLHLDDQSIRFFGLETFIPGCF